MAWTNWGSTSLVTNSYDAYGIPDSASGDDISTKGRFRYTGQMWLPELEMYYYKARIYSYKLGRFMQTDPIGYEDQFNLYAYVGNDPVNLNDPTGLCPNCVGGLVGGGIGAIVGGAATALEQYANGEEFDLGEIGEGALSGGIAGSITGVTVGAVNPLVAGAAEGAISSVASDVISGEEVSLSDAATSAIGGAVGGAIGRRATRRLLGTSRDTAM